jgi:phenylacetate-CoA ligase
MILDAETLLEHELFLVSQWEIDKHSTLCVVCFAMGMYVAGPLTMSSILGLGAREYPITIVTPGYSPDDVLELLPKLAPKYDQIILAGYPPYIKEIIDRASGVVPWRKLRTRFLLAGEGFNESWRTHMARVTASDPAVDFINLYGTADAAVVAHETVTSIAVRRAVANDTKALKRLFNSERLPSLLQFYPEHKYFEVIESELVFTAPGGIPLVRYNIHDSGGVITHEQCAKTIPQLKKVFSKLKRRNQSWNLPFVYVFGKSDNTLILYGANIYPENIRQALESPALHRYCSGKMIMHIKPDQNLNQRLHLTVECLPQKRLTPRLKRFIQKQIVATLLKVNSEYGVVHRAVGQQAIPVVHLVGYEDPAFRTTGKHRWAKTRGR